MKNLIVVVVLLLCLLAGCEGNNSADNPVKTWYWGDNGAVGARIGTKITENNEAGISMLWWPSDSEPKVLGLYGVHHFPDIVEFRNPLIVDFLPETLKGKAYLGGKLDINCITDETTVGPVAGVIFENTLFFETSVDKPILFGLRFEF